MKAMLLVGLGGFLGAISRYKLGAWVGQMAGDGRFPYGTFAVNIIGCLVIGTLAGIAERYNGFGSGVTLFLFTGLLGGFTTFSSFGLEAMQLLRRGDLAIAAFYVGASVCLGLIAVWLGFRLALMASH